MSILRSETILHSMCLVILAASVSSWSHIPDSKVHGANMGPIWGRQDKFSVEVMAVILGPVWVCTMYSLKCILYWILVLPHRNTCMKRVRWLKRSPHYWPFGGGIHQSTDFPSKGPLMISSLTTWPGLLNNQSSCHNLMRLIAHATSL